MISLEKADIRSSQIMAVVLVVGLLISPRWLILWWLIPCFLLYARVQYVIMKREELEDEDERQLMRERWESPPSDDASQGHIGITKRPE
jgi:hypothetical protein